MNLKKEDIRTGLIDLGLKKGAVILVHSSLSSLGYVEGGADTVIDALLEVTGDSGTVIVPSLTGQRTDSPKTPPVFDVRETPCWTGKIPETFRRRKDVLRSLHPTHSVAAIGAAKKEVTQGHEEGESPCDNKSPYYKNAILGGYIILIGVDQNSNTTVHCCEELAGVPYHLQSEYTITKITGYNREEITVRNKLHDWEKKPTDFNKFDNVLREKKIIKTGKIGKSTVHIIKAMDMINVCVEILENQPMFLVI